MSQSLSKVVVHVVYSTKNRRPFLKEPVREKLYAHTVGILNTLGCVTLAINGAEDHVHVLIIMSRTVTIAKMLEDMKRGSSRWLKTQSPELTNFAWQGGYSIFSVSESMVPTVKNYIDGQPERHRKMTFQEELRLILERHNIAFDEEHLWS